MTIASAALVFASAPAAAAGGGNAEALFQEARKLLQDGDVANACTKFSASLAAEYADGTLLALAACHEKEGKLVTAAVEYQLVVSATVKNPEAEKLARERAAALEKEVPMLAVTVPSIDGIQVTIDGKAFAPAGLAQPVRLDPGERVVAATAPGRKSWSARVTLAAGDRATLAIPALESDAPPPPPPAPPPPAPIVTERPAANGRRTAAFVVGGAGVASLGVGVVTGIMALGKASTIKDSTHCDTSLNCDQTGVDAGNAGKTLSLVSTVTVIAGLAGIGAGTFLFLTSKGGGKPAPATAVIPIVTRDAGGISISRRF